jgi:hypothetical protein
MAEENKDNKKSQDKIETEGHLTSIVTSGEENIKGDPLSKEIRDIRREIMTLGQSDIDRLEPLLQRFNSKLIDNCNRIKEQYERQGCPDVEVEPAIGYFIPDVNEEDAVLKRAEPSVIITAKDLSEDGLSKFLLAAGMIGEKYFQDAEILKFPITEEKFDNYIVQKSESSNETSLIGAVTEDNIIPTFEIIVDIPALLGEILAANLNEDYFENAKLYANIIMELANKQYAASTWPTRRKEFSTIFIREWDGARRNFEAWYYGFHTILECFSQENIRSLEKGDGMGGKTPTKIDRPPLQGYRTVNELLLIPQSESGILPGDSLVYSDLKSDAKRAKIVRKLVEVL